MDLLTLHGALSARDVAARGIPRMVLSRLARAGRIERVGRGLYALPDADVGEAQTVAEACAAVPGAVVCLLTALQWHGLTEHSPTSVWLALRRGRHRPKRDYPPIEPVWMSPRSFEYGVMQVDAAGVSVAITNPAKSVADAYKFRTRVGHDVAVDALRRYIGTRREESAELWEAARVCRVTNVISAHVEALQP